MKKYLAASLVLVMLLSLAGCVADPTPTESGETGKTDPTNQTQITEPTVSGNETVEVPSWSYSIQDRRKEVFTKLVFAGDAVGKWAKDITSEILMSQMSQVDKAEVSADADAILAEKGDLIVIADGIGQLKARTSAKAMAESLNTLVGTVKQGAGKDTVVMLVSLPYMTKAALGSISLEQVAQYNAAIRAVAMGQDVLYVNLYAAQGMRDWTVEEDGSALNKVGLLLAKNEIMQALTRACTVLAKDTNKDLNYKTFPVSIPDDAQIDAFKAAATKEDVQKAIASGQLGADLTLYQSLTNAQQEAVCQALTAQDRSGVENYMDADAVLNAAVMEYLAKEQGKSLIESTPLVYVAVGDSISYGSGAITPASEGYVPLLAKMISKAQGKDIRLINMAISGTRMSTMHKDGTYPAAKDTAQYYIISKAPDLVTMAYGINDLNHGTSLDTFIADYRQYLTEVTAGCPNAVIAVFGLCWESRADKEAKILEWNRAIKALAEEFGLIYVDTYADMYGPSWVLSDGLHPNNAGYRVMATTAFSTLSQHVDFGSLKVDTDGEASGEYDGNKHLSTIQDDKYRSFKLNQSVSHWTLPKFCFYQAGSKAGDAILFNSDQTTTAACQTKFGDAFTVSMDIHNFMSFGGNNQIALRFMSGADMPFLLNVYTNLNTYSIGAQYMVNGSWTQNLLESKPNYKGSMEGDDVRITVSRAAGSTSLHIRLETLDGKVLVEADTPANDVVKNIHYLELRSFACVTMIDNIVIS